jgi:hypothetical protein
MLLGRWRCVLSVFQLGSKSLSTATEHDHVILSFLIIGGKGKGFSG